MKDDVILLILKEDVEFDKCGEVDFFFNITNTHNAYLQRIIICFKIFSKLLGCVEIRQTKLIFIQNFARELYLHEKFKIRHQWFWLH